jgi:hypothetical protein
VTPQRLPLSDYGPACAHGQTGEGWLGLHHCHGCAAAVAEAVASMALARAAGEYDAEGYTPAERRAQQRKAAA